MLPLERQNKILDIITSRQAASVEELCSELYSSGATIRRDLAALENSGMLRRTHGGAVISDRNIRDFPLIMRENENLIQKNIIAHKAVEHVCDGQTLFLDASSTVFRMAEKLTGFKELRVITNALKTANLLSERDGIEVYCTGGRVRENSKSFAGAYSLEFVSRFYADIAFISCRGVCCESGITETSEDEAAVKRVYQKNARRTILLADSSKLGKRFFCKICDLSEVALITDTDTLELSPTEM